ncbi:MAG: CHAT domain-containing protein, partial [Cyanobacteria bacterium J06635_15]
MFKFHVPFQERFFRSIVLMLFGLVLALGVIFDTNSPVQALTASQLNQQGFERLHSGAAAEALSAWQAATEQYQTEENLEGVQGSQLNQTLAMQALGLYPRACLKLTNVLVLPAWPCAQDLQGVSKPEELVQALSNLPVNEINSIGLRLLGENLRLLGKLPESEEVLRHAQSFQIENPLEQARLGLALGATHQLSLQAALESFSRTDYSDIQLQQRFADKINVEAERAVRQYQSLMPLRELDAGLALQARLNLIDLFVDFSDRIEHLPAWALTDLSSWQALKPTAMSAITVVLEDTADFESLPAIEAIYGRLNLAKNLLAVGKLSNLAGESLDKGQLASQRWELTEAAVEIARTIDDKRALSSALGVSAALMEEEQFPASDIQSTYLRALALAQAVQATDIAYEWEYRLAQLYEAEGQLEKATQGYRAAIESLFQVRENLISVNSELRFSFRKNIEPVYRDYIGLLADQPTQATLSETVDVYEALQLAELENYLGCGRLDTAELDRSTVDLEVTSVNIINLGEVIKVVVRSPEGRYFGYGVPSSEVLPPANNLLANLQSSSFIGVQEADILPYAQALYQALLLPAREEGIIPAEGELSFIFDAPFQGIPMDMLHDGQQYLVESYSISNALRAQQRATQK